MSAGIRAGSSNDGYVQVNGNDIITALSGGNVGIGNTSPSTKLHVNGTITATNFVGNVGGTPEFSGDLTIPQWIIHAGDTDTKLGFPSDNAVDIFAGGKQVRLTSDGHLGINRTTPTAPITARRLDAGGSNSAGVIAEFANSSGYGVWFGQSSASGAAWGSTTGDFYWCTNGLSSQVERLRINSTGKVTVKSNAANSVAIALVDNDSTNEIWRVGQASDGDGYVEVLEDGGTVGCKLDASGNSFTMGNFGIGVASPSQNLQVGGDGGDACLSLMRTNAASNNNAWGHVFFENSSDATLASISARRESAADDAYLTFSTQSTGNTNSEKLRITSGGVVNIGANLTQTTYPFSVQKDLNSGGNLAYFANADSTYNQGLTLSFDSNKDIKWEGGSGSGGLIWKMGTRGYVWKIGSSDKLTIGSTGTLTLNNAITTHEANIAHFQATTNNKSGTVRINGHSGTNAVQGILELIGYAAGGGHGRHAFITSSSESGNYATQMSFKVRSDATWQHTSIPDKLTINSGYTGTVDVKGIPAHLRLYSQRDTSDWDSGDPVGKLDFYVGDDTSNNLPYNAAFIHCLNEDNNVGEPSGALVFGATTPNASGGAAEVLRITQAGQIRMQYLNVAKQAYVVRSTFRDITGHSNTGDQWFRCAILNSRTPYRVTVSTQGGNYGPGATTFTCLRSWDNTTFYVYDKKDGGSQYASQVRMQSDNGGGSFYLEIRASLSSTSQGFSLNIVPVGNNAGEMLTHLQYYGSNMSNLTHTSSAQDI